MSLPAHSEEEIDIVAEAPETVLQNLVSGNLDKCGYKSQLPPICGGKFADNHNVIVYYYLCGYIPPYKVTNSF